MPHLPLRRLLPLLALAAALLVLLPAAACAGTIQLSATAYTATKGQGDALITVTRSDPRGTAQIRYGAWHLTAQPKIDYRTPVGGRIDFADGQAEATFRVPLIDNGLPSGPVTVRVGIYGAYPDALGSPHEAVLTILDNPAMTLADRDPLNPLALSPPPPPAIHNPLIGGRFFVDRRWGLAARVIQQIRHHRPAAARKLEAIARQPEAKRFGSWTADPRRQVAAYLQRANQTDRTATPLLGTYRLKHLQCGGVSDTPAEADAYKRWYDELAAGIGNHRAVVFLEIDALITAPCLSRAGVALRVDEVGHAIDALAPLPHAVVYVDAGAADAHPAAQMAKLLRAIGVGKIQGFFLNSTHYDWTGSEVAYGAAIARRTGGKHFVVNTAVNGRGPLRPKSRVRNGNEVRCNPPGRGLGPKPTSDVPARWARQGLDGFFWIGNPGRSTGTCGRDEPPTGSFFLDYALMLVANARFSVR